MIRCNQDIREKAKEAGIPLWAIGDYLGLSDANFSRKLRKEFSEGERIQVLLIIEKLKDQVVKEVD